MRQISVRSFALVVGLAALVGCGSSSSSSDLKALCKQSCDKGNTCFPGLIDVPMCKADCDTMNTNCTNSAAIAAAAKTCLSGACDQLIACSQTVPDCQTGSGGSGGSAGGSGGSAGGSGGSGGSSNSDGGGN